MKDKEYDFLVFIGRFRPFHNGHRHVIEEACNKAKHVIILVGSSFQEPNLKNPWTYEEVKQMINSVYDTNKVIVLALEDQKNDSIWVNKIHKIVDGIAESLTPLCKCPPNIGLIGHVKDKSSYYLNLFPEWDCINIDNNSGINATDIRHDLFNNKELTTFRLPLEVVNFINRWKFSLTYIKLTNEFKELNY